MKIIPFSLILLLPWQFLTAQTPELNHRLRKEMAHYKEKQSRQIMLNRKQATANQEDYDVKYYGLDLQPDPVTEILSGTVEVTGVVLSATLTHVELNFWDGMNVSDVHITGFPALQLSYNHNNDVLDIDLDKTYNQSEDFSITISYDGRPQDSNYNSFDFTSYQGEPMIWTLSEPFGARAWWPCKDMPSDKADSVDIRVTVPEGLIVASNGTLMATTTENNQTTYWWHEQYPIVTYLVSLAIYPYYVYYDDYLYNDNADTMKIHFYVFPDNYDVFKNINARVTDMISCFSRLFGEYPFVEEKYGHADYASRGAMEHQTCSSFSFWNEWVYAHELAHQWWGDLITCTDFRHIWLNEGFASYSEALWYEFGDSSSTASEYQMASRYLGPGTIIVEDPETESIFNYNLTYNKSSWVLHMLRHVVGDSTFFEILQTYYSAAKHQYGTATTEDFQKICEQVSGINLQKFFQQWIYGEYYPKYFYSWQWTTNDSQYVIQLDIEQDEDYIFWMPIDVTVTTTDGESTYVVRDSLQSQSFEISVDARPLDLELDKDNWILKEVFTDPLSNTKEDPGNTVRRFYLAQNYPNPFNQETVINYQLSAAANVELIVYSITGRRVATLVSEHMPAGSHRVVWDADGFASGVYYYRLSAGGLAQVKKLALVR